mgnify:CR=1 FL=1
MHTHKTSNKDLEIGAKLGAMIQDSTARAQLIENPAETLSAIGVKSDMTIYADTADLVHLIIPAEIDADRVAAGDEAYFEELGKLALGTCIYRDLPEE